VLSLFVLPVPLGLIAWLWAREDLKKMNAGVMDPEGRGSTQAGKVCGMISVVLGVVALCLTFVWLLEIIQIYNQMSNPARYGL
jgi:hypothetical protein